MNGTRLNTIQFYYKKKVLMRSMPLCCCVVLRVFSFEKSKDTKTIKIKY